jgi:hypothetical protein
VQAFVTVANTIESGKRRLAITGTPGADTFLNGDLAWVTPVAAAAWGSITGTLSAQTDVQSALDAKSATSHTHTGVYEAANSNIQTHVGSAHAPATAQANADITKAEIEAKLTGVISSHSHASGADGFLLKARLASNAVTGANVTPISLTGLTFAFEANSTYVLEIYAMTQAVAATMGSGFQLDVSAAVTAIALSFTHQLANTGTVTGGSSIADDASVGVSSGRPTANVNTPVVGGGLLVTGANTGTAQLRYRSEVAAVSTCMAGTVLRVIKVA